MAKRGMGGQERDRWPREGCLAKKRDVWRRKGWVDKMDGWPTGHERGDGWLSRGMIYVSKGVAAKTH
jgi:hypothetical protein